MVEILRPLYEASDDWRRLIKLNEDRFALASDAAKRSRVLRETAELWESAATTERARRALEAARASSIPTTRTCAPTTSAWPRPPKAWDELAETYEDVLDDSPTSRRKRDLLAVLAEVHDEQRDDPRRALDAYDRLRAVDESEIEPLDARWSSLPTLLSDWPTLVRVLVAKADLVLDDEERASSGGASARPGATCSTTRRRRSAPTSARSSSIPRARSPSTA